MYKYNIVIFYHYSETLVETVYKKMVFDNILSQKLNLTTKK